jgi:hypothetical protein
MKTKTALAFLLSLALILPPGLPSSFWGVVTGAPAGSVVNVFVPGRPSPVAQKATVIHQGIMYYAVNVPADDPDTQIKEGGVEGDTVTFKIGGRVVGTGTWRGGTNVRLDLHVAGAVKRKGGSR